MPIGLLCGLCGAGLTVPVMSACEPWLHPLVSSSILWAIVGASGGLFGCAWSIPSTDANRSPGLRAVRWGSIAGPWAGAVWGGTLLAAYPLFRLSFTPDDLTSLTDWAICGLPILGAGYGLFAGAVVGAFHIRARQRFLLLASGGGLFGILAGGLSVMAVVLTRDSVHPLISSSLALAVVGFCAGLCGASISPQLLEPDEPDEPPDEDETAPPVAKAERVVRAAWRPWRISRPLGRVLPVLAATWVALLGAAVLVPSDAALALFAVVPLGCAVAHALYRQEQRLDSLEGRLGVRR
jgi:hypothetical protein